MNRPNLHTKRIVTVCGKYRVATISLLGSVARGEARETSDVDLLVTFSRPVSLLQMVSLERDLNGLSEEQRQLASHLFLASFISCNQLVDMHTA